MSTSTSRLSRSPWSMAKRAAMAPPSNCPTSAGGDMQVRSISAPSHVEHALGVQRAVRHLRGAVAREVGGDDAVGRNEPGDHAHPMGRVP